MKAFNQLQVTAFRQSSAALMGQMSDNAQKLAKAFPAIALAAWFATAPNANATEVRNPFQIQGSTVNVALPDGRNLPVQVENVRVVTPEDTRGSEVVRRVGGGAVGGVLGSQIGKGNGKTFWTIAGALLGSEVSNELFKPKPQVQADVRVGNGDVGTQYDPRKHEFRNGTEPLSEMERAGLQTWLDAATTARNELAANRNIINSAKYRMTFASEADRRYIEQELYNAKNRDGMLVRELNEARSTLSDNLWVAAMDFNRNVIDFMVPAASLISTPTDQAATSEQILGDSSRPSQRRKP